MNSQLKLIECNTSFNCSLGRSWAWVSGYEGIYMVSNDGLVKSVKRKTITKSGIAHIYEERLLSVRKCKPILTYVRLSKNNQKKTISIAHLVALHFIPNPNNYHQVKHIDGNVYNNHYLNIEWVSHAQIKLTDKDVKKIRLSRLTAIELASKYNITAGHIRRIKAGIKRKNI